MNFREKRGIWISWLAGEDVHAIWRQIASLLWDYAFFQTLNDLRKKADQHPAEGVGFNWPALRLLDAGFVSVQVTGIRKLTDPGKDVISLRRLVLDIRDSRPLLTREHYLACHRLPYDPAGSREEHFKAMAGAAHGFVFEGLDTEGPNAWSEAERAHERFDKLSDKPATARSKEDLVSPQWLDRLDSRIRACDDVRMFANKFIAHAADPLSRSQLTLGQLGVTLQRLAECHQALLEVAEFVGCRILQCSAPASIPTASFDPLENLDKAWTMPRDREGGQDAASELWEHNQNCAEKWRSEALKRFEQPPP